MSDSLVVCEVDPKLLEKLKKFRFRKETTNAAIIIKVDRESQQMVLEGEHEGISPDELRNEIPERQPRSPQGCNPQQQMMYAGSKNRLVQLGKLTKVFEIRNIDELTEDWLREKLAFFR